MQMGEVRAEPGLTARERQNVELAAAGEAFATLFHGAPDALLVLDHSRIVAANEAALARFGFPLEELVDANLLNLMVPECRDLVLSRVLQRSLEPYEAVARDKEGVTFPVEIATWPVRYHGSALRLVLLRDITDRKRAERAIRTAFQELAMTDALTQLYNRRAFEFDLRREISLAERFGAPLSLIAMDIDHFKLVNDRYGHPSGDRVLAMLASALRHTSRAGDLPARIGGDEFMLLLPRTSRPNAIRVAEKLRHRIEQSPLVEDIEVRVSIGVATVPDDGTTGEALLAAVDQAMYRAKQAGGGRVAFSS